MLILHKDVPFSPVKRFIRRNPPHFFGVLKDLLIAAPFFSPFLLRKPDFPESAEMCDFYTFGQSMFPESLLEMGIPFAFFAGGSLALLFSSLFAFIACRSGWLFSGIDAIVMVAFVTAFCAIALPCTADVMNRKGKKLTKRALLITVLVLTFFSVAFLSPFTSRSNVRHFINPIPASLRVHRGETHLFATYVHFSAPPHVIASIIHSKQLPIPEEFETSLIERSKKSRGWWQPANMTNPVFYMRHHKGELPWTEGIWVNGATNEAFRLIER